MTRTRIAMNTMKKRSSAISAYPARPAPLTTSASDFMSAVLASRPPGGRRVGRHDRRAFDVAAEALQVGRQRDDLLAIEILRSALCRDARGDLVRLLFRHLRRDAVVHRLAVRHAEHRHRVDALLDDTEVEIVREKLRIARHDRLRGDRPRILHVADVPQIGILAAFARQIRPDAARAPEERMIVDELAGLRVFAEALRLMAERSEEHTSELQ